MRYENMSYTISAYMRRRGAATPGRLRHICRHTGDLSLASISCMLCATLLYSPRARVHFAVQQLIMAWARTSELNPSRWDAGSCGFLIPNKLYHTFSLYRSLCHARCLASSSLSPSTWPHRCFIKVKLAVVRNELQKNKKINKYKNKQLTGYALLCNEVK